MNQKNIVNIVNFIRAADYRFPREGSIQTVKEQMKLAKKYQMPTTFLIQPDCFWDTAFIDAVEPEAYIEIGLWLEINKSLVEEAGCRWLLGEQEWNWNADTDFSLSYSTEERIRIVDCAMKKFKEYFGYYPKTVGSWNIDALTLEHLEQKYHVAASFNCKEQWGTDGYSLWGGYYNQAFYPCKKNALCPAQTAEEQINIPVFRMLGSDPILQYEGICGENGQEVITLEPAAKGWGDNREWVEWFFGEMIEKEAMSFGYAQTGQENGFQWEWQGKGYTMQMEILDRLWKEGKVEILKASDAGAWYRENYSQTPVYVMQGERDGKTGIWYNSKHYRCGLYSDEEKTYIRDLMLFDENYEERYLKKACTTKALWYDNLPIVDSYRWKQGTEEPTGVYFEKDGKILEGGCDIRSRKLSETEFEVVLTQGTDKIVLTLGENVLKLEGDHCLVWKLGNSYHTEIHFDEEKLRCCYEGFHYTVHVEGIVKAETKSICPKNGEILFYLENREQDKKEKQ